MTTILSSNEPLIIALDVTASMRLARDADTNTGAATRGSYAQERLSELLERLPRETRVTLLTFGADVTVVGTNVTGQQALAMLGLVGFNAATTNAGKVIEWCLTEFLRGQQRATLLLVTDGAPDDAARWEAWTHYNTLQGHPIAIQVLTLGLERETVADWNLRGDRHSVAELADVELMLGKPASTPPDGSSAAKADTQPPSVAPPTAPHAAPKPSAAPKAAAAKSTKGGKHE